MDIEILSRIQFAFTVGFHYIFPPVTIGMSWIIFLMLTKYKKTKDEFYKKQANFWLHIFSITFVMGVVSGIVMEFQFGTNWSKYSEFVGDIFGAPLAAEGIFAFFLESTFLGILLYGEKRVSFKTYWLSSLLVALGSTLSAFWIIVANSWQQTPAGFKVINGKAVLTDFWQAIFNPSTIDRYLHTIDGALITGAFFIMSISAYYLLKNKHIEFAKSSLKISLIVGLISSLMQLPIGHFHAITVYKYQPCKFAAFEGIWETGSHAPLLVFGIPNDTTETTDYKITLPSLASIFVSGDPNTVVKGLKSFDRNLRPPLLISFVSFHTMVGLGMFFIFITMLSLFLLIKNKLYENRFILKIIILSIPLPFIANELGWVAAEVGRQPWIVQNVLKTKDAFSPNVPVGQIWGSLIFFLIVYSFLFYLWIYLLRKKIQSAPDC